jgi:phospholipase/carboxylesterase
MSEVLPLGEFVNVREPGDPTLVMLHGTGGDEHDMVAFGHRLLSRAGVLSLRGKEPEYGSNRWFQRLAEGVFDEPNLRLRTDELADYVIRELPEVRRIAVGFSNGANIAAASLLLRPEAFHGAVLFAPMVPIQPHALPDLASKPILMVCGERDPMVPRFNAQSLATMFQTAGADLEVVWHPGGHQFGPTEVNAASAWIARHFPRSDS